MAVGETLLKITDYPFAYSAVFIFLAIGGYDIFDENALPFLVIGGILGTFLTIVDPFGMLVKGYVLFSSKQDLTKTHKERWDYAKSAFYTKSMNFEKEKIVGIIYFLLLITAFLFAINYTESFSKRFEIEIQNINCDSNCVKESINTIIGFFGFIILISMFVKGYQLVSKAKIVSTYLFSIGNPDIPQETKESISKFIDLGDWKTAEHWGKKLEEDLLLKRGKRDIIIKSAESVFRPLHEESRNIDRELKQMKEIYRYNTISPQKWTKLVNEGAHVMIDDSSLRKQIHDFYEKISQYNLFAQKVNRKVENIIKTTGSEIYNKNIRGLRYWVQEKSGIHTNPETFSCLLYNIHPSKMHEESKPLQVDVNYKKNGNDETEVMKVGHPEFHKFDEFWHKASELFEKDSELKELRTLCEEISKENIILQDKYGEQIELQWKM